MALATYPSVSSPVKSVQRGSAAGAGTVTITAVDINKSFVNIQGTTSSGTVSASFNMSMNAGNVTIPHGPTGIHSHTNNNSFLMPVGASSTNSNYISSNPTVSSFNTTSAVNAGNATVGAGSNNLVAAQIQGYLSNSTSLVVSGACRWEVVEYN